ncbi:MAG: DUF5702 domain-containing protein [Bacillus sp. (in: Bacteria)]|nr:DUF5702 domain-containing protein [Bacillus sp. (in: firmicutes)]MCM1426833.1 DUF5702 domain-containing protein [Eubacterium sp.]
MKKGYITVFCSLSLSLILSLVLTLIEGARMSAVRMKFECAADIGMNAVLAEYHRELLEQYDLLFVDTSYGKDMPSIANTTEHLRNYIQGNLKPQKNGNFQWTRDFLDMHIEDVEIIEYSAASDAEGDVLKRQIADYMADYPIGSLLEKISGNAVQIDGAQMESRDIAGERESYQAQIEEIGLPEEEVEEGVFEKVPLDNPADAANATRSIGVLNLVVEDIESISTVKTDLAQFISHRVPIEGNGVCEEAAKVSGMPNDILFLAYLFEKCGYYGNEKENSLLQYQIEYLIAGKDTDWQNLEQVAKRLLRWREVANILYLLSDGGKVAQAEAMALTLSAVALLPALTEPVKYTILYAWAYVESLQDVKTLLQGGKVPVYKTAADWKTGIDSIKNVKGSLTNEDGGRGLSYKEYLEVMLFLTNDHDRTFRAMDIMEMDIRKTPGNGNFRMDGCFDTYRARMSVVSGFGSHYEMERLYGYY